MEVSLSREFLERCIEVYLTEADILSRDIVEVIKNYILNGNEYSRFLFVPTFRVNMLRKASPGSYKSADSKTLTAIVQKIADELESDSTGYFRDIKVERKEGKI